MTRRVITAREQHQMLSPWRRMSTHQKFGKSNHRKAALKNYQEIHAEVPIKVLKQYSTFNPYKPEKGEPPQQAADRMAPYEETLKNKGWEGFGKLDTPPSYPTLIVGRSGQHAVLNGHHRLWAADRLGYTHVPVYILHGENDDWARQHGRPVESHISGLLKGDS